MFETNNKSRTTRAICIVTVLLSAAIALVIEFTAPAPPRTPIPLKISYHANRVTNANQTVKSSGLFLTNCSDKIICVALRFEVKSESGWANASHPPFYTQFNIGPHVDFDPGRIGVKVPKFSQPWRVHAEVSEPLTGIAGMFGRLSIRLRHPFANDRSPIDRSPLYGNKRDLWTPPITNANQSRL